MIELVKNIFTGKVHVRKGINGSLCNSYNYNSSLRPFASINQPKTDESVTCKHCLNILHKQNPNISKTKDGNVLHGSVTAKTFLPDSEEQINVKVCFGSRVNSIQTFFKTKAEKVAYIRGVKDACGWHHVKIDGKLV